MATMIEIANLIYSVSCKRDLTFYVHDLLFIKRNLIIDTMSKYLFANDAEEMWKDLLRT